MHPAKRRTLQKAKMASSFPTDVFYGPTKYCGLGMTDPYTRQEIVKIAMLLQESKGNTQTVMLLRSVAEGLKMEVGFPFTIGDTPYN